MSGGRACSLFLREPVGHPQADRARRRDRLGLHELTVISPGDRPLVVEVLDEELRLPVALANAGRYVVDREGRVVVSRGAGRIQGSRGPRTLLGPAGRHELLRDAVRRGVGVGLMHGPELYESLIVRERERVADADVAREGRRLRERRAEISEGNGREIDGLSDRKSTRLNSSHRCTSYAV